MRSLCHFSFVLILSTFTAIGQTIALSGKVTNTADGKIAVRGESFTKEIILKPDGSFAEIFPVNYTGTYTLTTAENRMSLYLTKGTKMVVTADNKDFYKTMVFTSKGSAENQYIVRKTAISLAINQQEVYSLAEPAFLAKLKEIKDAMLVNYNATKFDDIAFKANELRNIDYFEQLYLLNYPTYHTHYEKIEDFKTSDTFPKINSINLDNESEYLFSNPYKQIVNTRFSESVQSKVLPTDEYVSTYALPEIKKVNSPAIKNALLQTLSYEITPGNPNSSALYDELIKLSTNPIFKKELTDKYNKTRTLVAGKPSPSFEYENFKGGKTALLSLKGSYVYIDVWATWCGPCRQEIPSLLKVEEQYKGKNVTFVSISIDAKKDYDKWKKLVSDKQLGGIQLFADNDWNSAFVKAFAIDSIPRFIIIGPDGTIVNADAPRPSDPKLIDLFSDLKI